MKPDATVVAAVASLLPDDWQTYVDCHKDGTVKL
jgi:hypothetical protein